MTQMHPGPQPQRRGTDAFFDSIRGIGITRSTERWIAGVAGGLARRLGVDPLIVRGVLAVSILVGGLGLVLYGIAWLLLPEESDGRIHAQQLLRGDVDVAVLGAGAAIIAGLSVPSLGIPWFGQGWTDWWRGFAWLGVLGLVVVVIVTSSRGRRRRTPPPWQQPGWQQQPGWRQPGWQQPPPPAGAPAQPHPTYPMGETMSTTRESVADPDAAATEVIDTAVTDTAVTDTAVTDTAVLDTDAAQAEAAPDAPDAHGTDPAVGSAPTAAMPPVAPPPTGWGNGGQGWNGGPGWNGPTGPRQWAPPPPPAPRATRERGPGAAVLGVVTALTLLVLAGLLYSERMGWYHGPVALTTLTAGLALLGAAIVVTGLRGRRAGGVTALAVIGLLVAMPMTAAANWDGPDLQWVGGAAVGQVSQTPTSVSEAQDGFRLGAGDATIDLTQVPLTAGETVDVPIRVGAGSLVVIVPADVSATAHVEIGAGEVTWLDGVKQSNAGGATHDFRTSRAAAGEPVQLALDVRTGLGNVIFEEGN